MPGPALRAGTGPGHPRRPPGPVGVAGRAVGRLDGWFLAPAPSERLAAVRVLVGLYVAVWSAVRVPAHLGHIDQAADRWDPVGLLAFLDSPLPGVLVGAVSVGTPLLALAFAAGWRWPLVGPAAALAFLVVTTLDSSWGLILHTENLPALHMMVLAAAPGAGDAWVVRWGCRKGRGSRALPGPSPRYGWPIRAMALVVVLAYVLAGLAKLRGVGPGWGTGETLQNLVAHDNLRKAVLGDPFSPVGTVLVGHGWVFTPFAVLTLVVEVGAVVALLGGRWRTVWVVAAWLFHLGVLAVMAILFPYQLSGVAYAALFRAERLRPLRWAASRWTATAAPRAVPGGPSGRTG